jgi:ketosteroid isomerase-like protein
MRRWLLMLPVFAFAAGSPAEVPNAPAAAELRRLLDEFLEGASRNDIKVHERFWADDLVYTRSAGVRVGKAEILDSLRQGPESPDEPPVRYSAEDVRIQQYGDAAIVAFRLIGRTGEGDAASTTQYLNTGTFVKRKGEWRAVAWQATMIPEAESPAQ